MFCPTCLTKTKVKFSVPVQDCGARYRVRVCPECEGQIETAEVECGRSRHGVYDKIISRVHRVGRGMRFSFFRKGPGRQK